MIRSKNLFVLLLAVAFLTACGTKNDPASEILQDCSATGDVTYTAQMKTFFDTNCVSCHNPNGVKPEPSFDTYAGAIAGAARGVIRVQEGTMPPDGAGDITAQDICNYQAWINSGKIQ